MIIDAGVAFKLVVDEPGSEHAVAWIGRAELVAPNLVHAEVGNALWKRVRAGEIVNDPEVEERLADLASYFRTIDEVPFMGLALRLAIDLGHPIYDCIYLVLAEQLDDRLLTADRRVAAALSDTRYAARIVELGP